MATEALGRLRTTARSHGRVMILETMGRYAGWIAMEAGIAAGADMILIPEQPFSVEAVTRHCLRREAPPHDGCTLICMAEGAAAEGEGLTVAHHVKDSPDTLRLGGVAERLRERLEPMLHVEVRTTLLGHVQRGGTPTAYDRVLATRFGHAAAESAARGQFGHMVALQADRCVNVPLAWVAGRRRQVPSHHPLWVAAKNLGVSLGEA